MILCRCLCALIVRNATLIFLITLGPWYQRRIHCLVPPCSLSKLHYRTRATRPAKHPWSSRTSWCAGLMNRQNGNGLDWPPLVFVRSSTPSPAKPPNIPRIAGESRTNSSSLPSNGAWCRTMADYSPRRKAKRDDHVRGRDYSAVGDRETFTW